MASDKRAPNAAAAASGSAPEHDPAEIDQASQALFRLGRVFARRPLRDQLANSALDAELSAVLVVQTVQTATGAGEAPTIGVVAAGLGIDPSTASRLVAQTVRAGYLHRTRDATDGRSVLLGLTPRGETLAAAAANHQRAIFEELTKDWTAADRARFAQLFVRFAEAAAAMLADESETGTMAVQAQDHAVPESGS